MKYFLRAICILGSIWIIPNLVFILTRVETLYRPIEINIAITGLYLLGSIPFGIVAAKFFSIGDVRKIGSGNIGATNVLRSGNKYAALFTLVGDFAKGYFPLLFVIRLFPQADLLTFMNLLVLVPILGHVFPIWLNFKGGKGIATGFGMLLALSPWGGLVSLIIWLTIAFITRYSSLASLSAVTFTAIFNLYFKWTPYEIAPILLALVTIFTHKENIIRLISGRETKIGSSTKQKN